MIHIFRWSLGFVFLLIVACNSADKKATVSDGPSKLYLDYKVSAEEGAENVVILLQFKNSDLDDKSIALEGSSHVTLDGEVLVADSAREAGVFYEVQRPLQGFAGTHTIVYTDDEGKKYQQEFKFNPVALEGLPEVISRTDLSFSLGANQQEGKVQVLVVDTSFESADINEEYPVESGKITIKNEDLQKVTNGPIAIEIYKEQIKDLPNGRLVISYAVKREAQLQD
jgi:hypothetical protein